MRHLVYVGVLAACVLGTLPLEWVFGARVYRRWRRAAWAILPVAAVFLVWDVAVTAFGWWRFDPAQVMGVFLGGLPLEEWLFFLVIPVCGLLTFEAVSRLRPQWRKPPDRHDRPGAGASVAEPEGGPADRRAVIRKPGADR